MLKNYIKTALRGFSRHKSSFFINLTGLSIGLTCSFLIVLWVLDELKMDQYHESIDHIYQVMEHQTYSDEVSTTFSTPGILARNLKQDFPEFEYASTYTWNSNYLFSRDNFSSRDNGLYVENDFLKILDIDLVYGNVDELLTNPNTIVLSEDMAKKYFRDTNPVGQGITIDNDEELTVTGVFRNMPSYSSFQFDCLLRYDDWLEDSPWASEWGNNGPRTIAKLVPGVSVENLNGKIEGYVKTKDEDDSNVDLFVYPFANRYLYSQFENKQVVGGRIEYVRLFSIVAIFILLIACINFMNLSTAKAAKRAKEVGIRKSIGAGQGSLIGQFLGESIIISFVALFISLISVELFLPIFNDLTDKAIFVDYGDTFLMGLFFGTVILTGLVSGSYPAFYLSSLEVVKTLKGTLKSSRKEAFARQGLVVFQFSLSIVLIISTIIIYRQIQFTQSKNLGYNKDNLISFNTEDQVGEQWEVVKGEIQKIPGVIAVSRSTHSMLWQNSNTSGLDWEGKHPDTRILFENIGMDYGLIQTMGMEMVDGRTYSPEFGTDSSKIIFNETAIKVMGLENPVGKTIQLWDEEREIVGVVKDFHFQSFRTEVKPVFFRLVDWNWKAFVRISSENVQGTLAEMEGIYKQFNTNYPFNYSFMDEDYASLYEAEVRVGALARYFSFIAIFISCLGLFGLSAFTAERRAKEVGVRKVLGASVSTLVALLSRDFTMLVLIAIAVSVPISWYIMQQWMSEFAYSSGLEWWVFLIAGLAALVIAWLTVSWQSIKAAIANPVDVLNNE